METSLYTAFVLFVATCLFILQRSQGQADGRVPRLPAWLVPLSLPLAFIVSFVLLPSDPATWSFANVVLYLAEPSLDPLRLFAVTVLGGILFFSVVYLLYGSRRR